MPLTGPRQRQHDSHQVDLNSYEVADGVDVWGGGLTCVDATGKAVPAADDPNLKFVGLCFNGSEFSHLDGRCEVDVKGQWSFKFQGPTPIPGVDRAFLIDDDTLTTDAASTAAAMDVGPVTEANQILPGEFFVRIQPLRS